MEGAQISTHSQRRVIGITGGIATGKTMVANYLSDRYHLPILDADILAREVLTSYHLGAVRQRFGDRVFRNDGSLDRRELGRIIFSDPAERSWLQARIHPLVQEGLIRGALAVYPRSVIMVVPLLFEANFTDLVSEIWVVTCAPEVQLQRLMERNHFSKEESQARINAQWPIDIKVSQAHVVISSDCELAELYASIDRAYASYSPRRTEDI